MKRLLLIAFILLASPAFAVQPDEMLDDPVLEDRARDISAGLRCIVCQNESIDESNAELARDLRLLVRERLVAGDSDDEAVAYIVARYGEFVLLNPRASGSTLILWLAGPVLVLIGGAIAVGFVRNRARSGEVPIGLSPEEEARLKDIMGE